MMEGGNIEVLDRHRIPDFVAFFQQNSLKCVLRFLLFAGHDFGNDIHRPTWTGWGVRGRQVDQWDPGS